MVTTAVETATATLAGLPAKAKIRVGKIYLGNPHPGWPSSTVDLDAELRQIAFQERLKKLAPPRERIWLVARKVSERETTAQPMTLHGGSA